eukprot:m.373479 g.373479  ORF g.373479 m.373479 type:complete len:153 (+) comp19998_c2_seq10:453-911(+)
MMPCCGESHVHLVLLLVVVVGGGCCCCPCLFAATADVVVVVAFIFRLSSSAKCTATTANIPFPAGCSLLLGVHGIKDSNCMRRIKRIMPASRQTCGSWRAAPAQAVLAHDSASPQAQSPAPMCSFGNKRVVCGSGGIKSREYTSTQLLRLPG